MPYRAEYDRVRRLALVRISLCSRTQVSFTPFFGSCSCFYRFLTRVFRTCRGYAIEALTLRILVFLVLLLLLPHLCHILLLLLYCCL